MNGGGDRWRSLLSVGRRNFGAKWRELVRFSAKWCEQVQKPEESVLGEEHHGGKFLALIGFRYLDLPLVGFTEFHP